MPLILNKPSAHFECASTSPAPANARPPFERSPTSHARALHFDPAPAPSNLRWATSNASMLALPTSNAHATPSELEPALRTSPRRHAATARL
ncbi:hypothetical protein K438DRAFT_1871677 [Mycena galopus ATCC 62051]|nr:hypothetical protein K438DRAFT_1871677 [Mycena galopus ATCC 62051]